MGFLNWHCVVQGGRVDLSPCPHLLTLAKKLARRAELQATSCRVNHKLVTASKMTFSVGVWWKLATRKFRTHDFEVSHFFLCFSPLVEAASVPCARGGTLPGQEGPGTEHFSVVSELSRQPRRVPMSTPAEPREEGQVAAQERWGHTSLPGAAVVAAGCSPELRYRKKEHFCHAQLQQSGHSKRLLQCLPALRQTAPEVLPLFMLLANK